MKKYKSLFFLLIVFSCSTIDKRNTKILENQKPFPTKKKTPLTLEESRIWHFMDVYKDTVPGISLEKANEFLKEQKSDTIVVAIIDMAVDIEHEDLKQSIWKNPKELDNGIDDDGNGYIDDLHGWNFLGLKNGSSIEFTNFEFTRLLRKYRDFFEGKKDTSLLPVNEKGVYNKALKTYNENTEYADEQLKQNVGAVAYFKLVDSIRASYFKDWNFSGKEIDSLIEIEKDDAQLAANLEAIKTVKEYGVSEEDVNERYFMAKEYADKLINLDYNERVFIGDSPEDINDIDYGNNIVNHNVKRMSHGTSVAGVLAANRTNNIGAMGVFDKIKIMPVVVSGYGDEHDKDMALAIRYAVDNGAKIINISSGKLFSMHENWVLDAISYAAQKDVLIVKSAGNRSANVDVFDNFYYANDQMFSGKEIADNFIVVGSSSSSLDKTLKTSSSSYGKINVDVFAPGDDVYTTVSGEKKYDTKGGTSSSVPLVSGVAAMICSYYPNIKVKEVKNIILNSSIKYDILVEIEKDSLVPFNTLSKSGGILNAYNAVQLASKSSAN